MTFFAKNLSYVYESGRKSVMELLGTVITKFESGLIREYADLLFVALVMVYGFILDVLETETLPYIAAILEDLNTALSRSTQSLADAESCDPEDTMPMDLDWQTPYHALAVHSKALRIFPDFAKNSARVQWEHVVPHLLFPHAWVRMAVCRLLRLLLAAVPAAPLRPEAADGYPLSNVGMREVARRLCLQLKSKHLDEALGIQVVKNLFYLGKCFYAMPVLETGSEDKDENEDESDGENTDTPKEKEAKDVEMLKQQNPLPWLFSKLSYQVRVYVRTLVALLDSFHFPMEDIAMSQGSKTRTMKKLVMRRKKRLCYGLLRNPQLISRQLELQTPSIYSCYLSSSATSRSTIKCL
ncbi:hypothetical protein H0H81_005341 [Sphagnurus paluster]|uniref:Uncharacterized protein n=1 Tax=Sphagnurus paluster TaxID=117069 RepID=A0A9P7FRX1_9AGAR|nr:hypothetical protein H0H81_005341 [Sphagnurus paluster]